MDVKEYILTEKGRKECEIFISELKAKRKEILDAGIDTADETFVDYTPEELFEDLNSRFDYKRDVGIMNNAESIKPSFIRYFIHWLRKEHLLRIFIENYEITGSGKYLF